jgi:uncharacterized protein
VAWSVKSVGEVIANCTKSAQMPRILIEGQKGQRRPLVQGVASSPFPYPEEGIAAPQTVIGGSVVMQRQPRLVPEIPFPAYPYIPGQNPRPQNPHIPGVAIEPQRWWQNSTYLLGVDLFNAGYYWEAHEQFEGLWLAAGRKGVVADFFKALIKLAAAGVKQRMNQPASVRSQALRAAQLLRGVAEDRFLGLNLPELIAWAEAISKEGWDVPGHPGGLSPCRLPDEGSAT